MSFLYAFGELIKKVAEKNFKDDKVKTADKSVFEEVQKKVETVEAEETTVKTRADILKEYREKIKEAQVENEANPNVETAHGSVYDDLMAEVENLRQAEEDGLRETILNRGVVHQPIRVLSEEPGPAPSVSRPNLGSQAVTNSMGGSLAFRTAPDMGAPQSKVRIPDKSLLNVIEYSENSINLDGKRSRFVLVDYNGHRGWILESYLNFN